MAGQAPQSTECSNILDRRTAFRSNADGLRVALRVHAEDDHSKESHLCQTAYFVMVTRRDGASTEQPLESIDDSWGRSVKFWIDGFALQGRRMMATIVEQGEHPIFDIVVYSLPSDKTEIFSIPRHFIEQIPPTCRASLAAIGMTRRGSPVVGFSNGACHRSTAAWSLRPGHMVGGKQMPSRPSRLFDRSAIESLDIGESTSAQ